MRTHKWKSWKRIKPKEEKRKLLNDWQFVNAGKRSFALYKGKRPTSSKEIEIASILSEMGITFFREISFDLRKRFDFYLPDIDLVIEYDGWHHFDSNEAVKRDLFKEQVLKNMGIKLIRYNKNHDLNCDLQKDLLKLMPRL